MSQRSRFSNIFLTVFVRRFLPGLKEATTCSTCWSLKVQTNVKQQRQSHASVLERGRGSHLRCVSNHVLEAVHAQDVMAAAQSDGEDHLELCEPPQAAEDDVDPRGRENLVIPP